MARMRRTASSLPSAFAAAAIAGGAAAAAAATAVVNAATAATYATLAPIGVALVTAAGDGGYCFCCFRVFSCVFELCALILSCCTSSFVA